MANTKLQIKIYQANAQNNASTFTGEISQVATDGVIVFDEYTQKIGINKKWFGIDDLATYNTLKSTVNTLSSKVGDDSVADQISDALETALGKLTNGKLSISSIPLGQTDEGQPIEPTVENYLKALQTAISTGIGNANTNISNLQSALQTATKTDNESLFVVRDKATDNNHTDFKNTTAIQTAINTAESNAATDATNKATAARNAAVSDVVGNGGVSSKTDELDDNTVWLKDEEKTLSHLKELINTLGGEDLSAVQADIALIKQELSDPSDPTVDTLSTILDHLKTLYGGTEQKTFNVNNGSGTTQQTTLAGIISALETYIGTVNSKITTEIQKLDAEVTSSDGTNVQVKVKEVDGKITAVNVTTDNTVNSTDVNTAITNAIGALDATADSTKTAINGDAARTAQKSGVFALQAVTETDGKLTSMTPIEVDPAGAATAAENAAKAYADNIISWTVVTGNESGNGSGNGS